MQMPERPDVEFRLKIVNRHDLRAWQRGARGERPACDRFHRRIVIVEVVQRVDRHVVASFRAGEDDGPGLLGDIGRVVRVIEMSMADKDVVRLQIDEILNDERRTPRLDLQTSHKGIE